MSGDILDKKKKSSLSRSPRITQTQEIEKLEKKFSKPGPGAYTIKEKHKVKGAFNLQDSKGSFLEESEFLSMQTPAAIYEKKYDQVQKKAPTLKIHPDNKKEDPIIVPKSKLPCIGSYEDIESYKNTQLSKPRFFMSKAKVLKRHEEVAKSKMYIPGVGKYDTENSFNKSTKGLARGWK